ncbi:BTAD domain-containing putative transcriptional regulator [Lentzea sp. BCCO 10_0061]|uniref:BTAD domain-containing putative transcriptional regulator n=1 Tax=Lentzea sokolovensis TaxID=3095429 RepID=A0ABU4V7W2_9PSEU|nr:BTAD domain-containing putative transcriptional regulator [Lentzea sp. BCCO 10_0061]MDX8146945.1 BTAD domain-containing putative transcriptional regulator [Lentzea sp. BCCO 10_0061]
MNAEFRLLGPLEVVLSGNPVKIDGARQRKLLTILLLNANRVVPVDQLVAELWHEPPQTVRQQIHNAIGSLRRKLKDAADDVRVTRTDIGYRLEVAEEAIDLHAFQSRTRAAYEAESRGDLAGAIELLRCALAEWRGTALSGLDGVLIDTTAASLNESRLTALEQLLVWRLRSGESSSLISELTQLVGQHPLRESLRGSLMRALYMSGRQADALTVYEECRRVLADELGIDPGDALRELHLSILNGSVTTPARPPASTVPLRSDAQHPSKSYLPYDTSDFSGRSAELAQLLIEVGREQPTTLVISAIDGMGGVGKTTLAVHLAHQISKSYPDGQYFVDLHGFTTGVEPITAEQALDQLLRDIGVPPELVPSGIENRSALWRSRLAGTRSLLLIDNAVDAAHVRPLLPGQAGVLVLVTSRRRLSALDGATPMSLNVLTPQEAVDMLTKVVGEQRTAREPDAVEEIVRLCGYLPLAIRIAAARLRDRSSWTATDLVTRLRDHKQRVRFLQVEDRNVMSVLKLSYQYLSPSQRKVFRLLSLHPGTHFDTYSAAALADIEPEQAEACLDALFEANLVKQNSSDQFHFHDLVRDCAFQLVTETDDEDEQRAAIQRLLDYYLSAIETWSLALSAGTARTRVHSLQPTRRADSPAEAAAVLNQEFPNLDATVRYAAQNGWHSHTWQLVSALETYLRAINYGGRSHELYTLAAEAADKEGDVLRQSICWQGLAAVCREHGRKEEAVRHLRRAIELSDQLGDRRKRCSLLVELGFMRVDLDLLEEGEQDFLAAQALIADDTDDLNHGVILNNLGVVYRDLGRYDESLNHFTEALARTPPDNQETVLLATWNIATVHHAKRDHESAVRMLDEMLSECRTRGYGPGEALARLGLCAVHRALGNFDKSLDHGRLALTSGRRLKMHRVECEVLNALGETALAAQDIDHAEKVFAQAEETAANYSFARYRARALEGFAHVAHARGHVDEAEQRWREAVDLYPKGMIEVGYARRHLETLDDEHATCFRCEPPQQNSPPPAPRRDQAPAGQ